MGVLRATLRQLRCPPSGNVVRGRAPDSSGCAVEDRRLLRHNYAGRQKRRKGSQERKVRERREAKRDDPSTFDLTVNFGFSSAKREQRSTLVWSCVRMNPCPQVDLNANWRRAAFIRGLEITERCSWRVIWWSSSIGTACPCCTRRDPSRADKGPLNFCSYCIALPRAFAKVQCLWKCLCLVLSKAQFQVLGFPQRSDVWLWNQKLIAFNFHFF